MLPRAVLFDVDGTLLDTTEFILGAYEHAFASFSVAAPPRERLTLLVAFTAAGFRAAIQNEPNTNR